MTRSLRGGVLAACCVALTACSDDDGNIDSLADGGTTSAGSGGSPAAAGSSSTSGAGSTGDGAGTSGGGATNGGAGSGGEGKAGSAGAGGLIDPNGGAPAGAASDRHTARPSGSMPGTTAGYWEYVPPHYGNGALYPLLVFRHGIGENGSGNLQDLKKVLAHGPPKLIEADQWPEDRKFIVLSAQHPGEGCSSPQENDDFLRFALDNYDVDPKRVYITGLSCGAIGSWNYLGAHTDEIVAAAVLICGNGRPAFQKAGCKLGNVPIWAFHGDQDGSVPVAGSTEAIASLRACTDPAPVDAKLTVYPGVPHDSWTMTYNLSDPKNDIYAWLMSHSKQ